MHVFTQHKSTASACVSDQLGSTSMPAAVHNLSSPSLNQLQGMHRLELPAALLTLTLGRGCC
jgi:hypothetical protein